MSNKIELIIFDCDGVLVDSERLANQVFADVLYQECGLKFSLEDMFRIFVGKSSKQCMSIVEDYLGHEPPSTLEDLYEKKIQSALEIEILEVKGISDLLKTLTIPYCVASSGSHKKMKITLGNTGLYDYFSGNIFSSSDVENGKPAPDLYLYAAKKMGNIEAKNCLVIEDSPTGIMGAKAAKMLVFAYSELIDCKVQLQAGAKESFDQMRDLPRLISKYQDSL
ncbi:HAD family hydrolase [bacterium]|nr:HAD family hydrolase [bacterium]